MIAVINRLPVKERAADTAVGRFANGQGFVQDFPGFVSMEVLRSDDADEVMVDDPDEERPFQDLWEDDTQRDVVIEILRADCQVKSGRPPKF